MNEGFSCTGKWTSEKWLLGDGGEAGEEEIVRFRSESRCELSGGDQICLGKWLGMLERTRWVSPECGMRRQNPGQWRRGGSPNGWHIAHIRSRVAVGLARLVVR